MQEWEDRRGVCVVRAAARPRERHAERALADALPRDIRSDMTDGVERSLLYMTWLEIHTTDSRSHDAGPCLGIWQELFAHVVTFCLLVLLLQCRIVCVWVIT